MWFNRGVTSLDTEILTSEVSCSFLVVIYNPSNYFNTFFCYRSRGGLLEWEVKRKSEPSANQFECILLES